MRRSVGVLALVVAIWLLAGGVARTAVRFYEPSLKCFFHRL